MGGPRLVPNFKQIMFWFNVLVGDSYSFSTPRCLAEVLVERHLTLAAPREVERAYVVSSR